MNRLAECRDCHDPIRFVEIPSTTRQGSAYVAVNPSPGPAGTIAARLLRGRLYGRWITATAPATRAEHTYNPHSTTCPERASSTTTPTEPDHPALF